MSKGRCWQQTRCIPEPGTPGSVDYRYLLGYRLQDRHGLSPLLVIQLNPSKAGAARNDSGDQTTRIVAGWAWRRRCYGSVLFLNLFARRCTDWNDLHECQYERAVGDLNDEVLLREAALARDNVVAAWGKWDSPRWMQKLVTSRSREVVTKLQGIGVGLQCLAPSGHPLHGRLWRDDYQLEPFLGVGANRPSGHTRSLKTLSTSTAEVCPVCFEVRSTTGACRCS
jgi:hypothetical protein